MLFLGEAISEWGRNGVNAEPLAQKDDQKIEWSYSLAMKLLRPSASA